MFLRLGLFILYTLFGHPAQAELDKWPKPSRCFDLFLKHNIHQRIGEYYLINADHLDQNNFPDIFTPCHSPTTLAIASEPTLNAQVFPSLIRTLIPFVEQNRRGLIRVNSPYEATQLTNRLNDATSSRFAALHSELPANIQDDIRAAFANHLIDYIITDFGDLHFPQINLFVYLRYTDTLNSFVIELARALMSYEETNEINVLGLWNERGKNNRWMSLSQILNWFRENEIHSSVDFFSRYNKPGRRPWNVPSDPARHYGLSWPELTGVQRVRKKTLEEFLLWAMEVNLKSSTDFRKRFGTKEKRPADIPHNPPQRYDVKWREIRRMLKLAIALSSN